MQPARALFYAPQPAASAAAPCDGIEAFLSGADCLDSCIAFSDADFLNLDLDLPLCAPAASADIKQEQVRAAAADKHATSLFVLRHAARARTPPFRAVRGARGAARAFSRGGAAAAARAVPPRALCLLVHRAPC